MAAETVHDIIAKKLLVPCTTRWNSFYDALARICGIPMVELNTIASKFGLTAVTECEHQFIREYCTVMKPLTVALDILQGEDQCYHGTLPGDVDFQDPATEEWPAHPNRPSRGNCHSK